MTTSVPRVEASSRSSTNCKSVSGIDSPSSSATFLCVKFTPGLRAAAELAEFAATQGKFWEMHDLLFANQDSFSEATFHALSEKLGLKESEAKHGTSSKQLQKAYRRRFRRRRSKRCEWDAPPSSSTETGTTVPRISNPSLLLWIRYSSRMEIRKHESLPKVLLLCPIAQYPRTTTGHDF